MLTIDDNHKYWLDGKLLDWPSPTFLLETMGIVNYEDYPVLENYNQIDYYKSRGSQVHSATYRDDTDDGFETDGLKPEVKVRVDRWRNFKKDSKVEVVNAELPIYNTDIKMVGCLDRIANLKLRKTTQRVIIDIKSGEIPKWTGLQLAFYELILNDGYYRRFAVGLGKDPYDLKEFTDHRDRTNALTLLNAYRIREEYK